MTGISERQSLTREEKFVALVHIYAELRLPFDAALDAAEADLLREQNEGQKETARRLGGTFSFPRAVKGDSRSNVSLSFLSPFSFSGLGSRESRGLSHRNQYKFPRFPLSR
jgi:hypothetical protein